MRIFKGLIFSLLMITMVLSYAHEAEARGSQVPPGAEPIIEVFPTAQGTKYSGPLTIYYILDPVDEYELKYYMHFFMRLRKGSDLYSFSGVTEESYDYKSDIAGQQQAITDFVQYTVIPILYPGELPTALLKSINMLVEDNEIEYSGCCRDSDGLPMRFVIVDVTIAVQD